ncbi:MliC family protein [Kangiella marina]|uniref:C-type lysozyme inhibitor domain-containing protein n=1 Tax=Kangiella marina TaxID=1079178 RepID=A0ABP8INE0_9GAMM
MHQITQLLGIIVLTVTLIACDSSTENLTHGSKDKTHDATRYLIDSTPETPGKTLKPSFDCAKVESGSIEATICDQPQLAKLDNQLATVYQQALDNAGETSKTLKAIQRGWIKGRNDCWKSSDIVSCIENSYQYRIAELQAKYRLVTFKGPIRFVCDQNPKNEFFITFFETEPPTLIAERGDQTSLMYNVSSASGAKYQGQNETFWEHQGEALIVWGYQAPELKCRQEAH